MRTGRSGSGSNVAPSQPGWASAGTATAASRTQSTSPVLFHQALAENPYRLTGQGLVEEMSVTETTARLQMERTWSGEWVTNKMVRPSRWKSLTRSMHFRWNRSSPTANTSSITRMSGINIDRDCEAQPHVHPR